MPETGAGRISLVQHDDATQLNCLNLSICKKNAPSHLYHTQVAEGDLKFKLGRDIEG